MDRRVNIIHPEAFLQSLADAECGKTLFAEVSGEHIQIDGYDIAPPEGYESPQQFPDCCGYHRDVFEKSQEWFDKFPNCCKWHKRLAGQPWFDKNKYSKIASKVVNQLSYTEHIIVSKIDSTEWFEVITEYIDYNHSSFGSLPTGYGSSPGLDKYIFNVEHYLKETQRESIKNSGGKVEKLLTFVRDTYISPKRGTDRIDFNQLHTTYTNWLKIFPFNISYFAHLRSFFEKQFPILKDVSKRNRYSNTVTARVLTQKELVDWLTNLTRQLTKSINSVIL